MRPVPPSSPARQPGPSSALRDDRRPGTASLDSAAWTPRRSIPTRRDLRDRLLPPAPLSPARMWLLPLLTIVLGGFLRFWHLGRPQEIAFDETYYVKDSWSIMLSGYERKWPEDADEGFAAGTPPEPLDEPAYAVHPPLGKVLIGLGMRLFGAGEAFGWRFSSAVAGTLMIALVVIAAAMLFRSPIVAAIAGLLLSVDGLHLSHSRLALLDIFLALFVLLAFVLLLVDRQDGRTRLAERLGAPPPSRVPTAAQDRAARRLARRRWQWGPFLGVRWWRVAAGVSCGLAVGVKWNALYFVAALGLLTVIWDVTARRTAGIRRWLLSGVLLDGIPAFLAMIPVALVTYLATWAGWLAGQGGYHRQWAQEHPGQGVQWLPGPLRSLWEYHVSAYDFHVGLSTEHTYMSQPWDWLVLGRPTSYFYESPTEGQAGCEVAKCAQQIFNQGNPAIWWTGLLAAAIALVVVALRRDWRLLSLLGLLAAGWAPWLLHPERTKYFFYALPYMPFLVLLLAGVAGLLLPRRGTRTWPARLGWLVVGLWLIVVLIMAAFFWPLWSGQVLPYDDWRARMWFDSWI
ncbi:dolichyl-phosphate-mannose--protein mannosyltransferase [Kocuria palustris]|uniref:dolichyl-phosphate-mannose--protein mannosyltransferase n=1 Tax=Kocuria palustris TaxID=71999 RepID=UPI0011A685AB|nr:phospholipid carrier-dependent glycosyltransferase [Kocuria palustris]